MRHRWNDLSFPELKGFISSFQQLSKHDKWNTVCLGQEFCLGNLLELRLCIFKTVNSIEGADCHLKIQWTHLIIGMISQTLIHLHFRDYIHLNKRERMHVLQSNYYSEKQKKLCSVLLKWLYVQSRPPSFKVLYPFSKICYLIDNIWPPIPKEHEISN